MFEVDATPPEKRSRLRRERVPRRYLRVLASTNPAKVNRHGLIAESLCMNRLIMAWHATALTMHVFGNSLYMLDNSLPRLRTDAQIAYDHLPAEKDHKS